MISSQEVAILMGRYNHIENVNDLVGKWMLDNRTIKGITILYGFDDAGNEMPIQSGVGAYDGEKFFVRSIFSKSQIYLLNEKIFSDMTNQQRFPINSELLLDTQIGKYALSYFNDRKKFITGPLGQSFEQLIDFIFKSDITFNFAFYNFENYANYLIGKNKEITNQLFALHKLANMDREHFLKTREVKLPFDGNTLKSKVFDHLESFENKVTVEAFDKKEQLQTHIAAIVLKSVLLKKSSLSKEDKVLKLVEFMDETLSVIMMRELYICGEWLLGENISLFDPVNGGQNLHEMPKNINGIAWDLLLLRFTEEFSTIIKHGVPTIAYYASFDRRIIEVGELFKSKGAIFPGKEWSNKFYMIPDVDIPSWVNRTIGESKNNEVFNHEAMNRRAKNKPSYTRVATIRKQLEYEVIKAFSTK